MQSLGDRAVTVVFLFPVYNQTPKVNCRKVK